MAPFASGVASDIPQAVLPGCLDFYIIVFPVSLLVFVSLVTLSSPQPGFSFSFISCTFRLIHDYFS